MGITFNPFTGNLDISGSAGPLVITDTFVVNSEAEMLALTVQRGDLAVRTDLSKTFILQGDDPTVLSNWVELATPPDAVTSVNTQTGDVVLGKADVGLDQVDNTSDLDKPISTSTQDALDLKYDASNPANYVDAIGAAAAAPVQSVNTQVGDVVLGKADVGLGNVDNTADLDKPISTAMQDALDLKYDASNPAGYITLAEVPADLVSSVNGQVGIVQLNAEDIPFTPTVDIVATDVQAAIEELSNDLIAGTTDVFQDTKEPTGYVNRTDSTMSFDDVTLTFTIAPLAPATSFEYYIKGKKVVISTTKQHTITSTAGNHFIYFDENGNLGSLTNFDPALFSQYAFTAIVYWNSETNSHTYFADERHGITMDGGTHAYLHTVFGARFISGHALYEFIVNGDGDDNLHAQFKADSGTIRDEDIIFQSPQQTQIPILYRMGASGLWRKKAADAFPIIYTGTAGYTGTLLPYNQFTGGSWQLTELGSTKYVLVHVFATNDIENPILGIQGTTEYGSVADARLNANLEIASLAGLPLTEFVAVGSVIFQTSSAFDNTPHASITSTDTGANYVDFRGTELYTPAGEATTHGLLSGLSSDDHLQYLLVSGTRAMTGDLNMGVHKISNVVDPTSAQDASTKSYVDTADNLKLNKTTNIQKNLTLRLDYQDEWGPQHTTFTELNSWGIKSRDDNSDTSAYSYSVLDSYHLQIEDSLGYTTIIDGSGIKFYSSLADTLFQVSNTGAEVKTISTGLPIAPTLDTQLVSKQYVDTADALKVAKAGDTMSGTLTVTNGVNIVHDVSHGASQITNTPGNGFEYVGKLDSQNAQVYRTDNAGEFIGGKIGIGNLNVYAETALDGVVSEIWGEANLTGASQLYIKNYVNNNVTTIDPGQISLLTNNVASMPTLAEHVATMAYVDQEIAAIPGATDRVAKAGDTMTGNLIIDNGIDSITTKISDGLIEIKEAGPNFGASVSNLSLVINQAFTSSNLDSSSLILSDVSDTNIRNLTLDATASVLQVSQFNGQLKMRYEEGQISLLTFGAASLPSTPQHVTTKAYVDTGLSSKLNLSGGTMTGEINMGTNAITNVSSISDSVLDISIDIGSRVLLDSSGLPRFSWGGSDPQGSHLDAFGYRVSNVATPYYTEDAANKQYVDTAVKVYTDAIVGSAAQVTSGVATHSSLESAVSAVGQNGKVYLLPGTHTVTNLIIADPDVTIEGVGRASIISGPVEIDGAAANCMINKVKIAGALIVGSSGNIINKVKITGNITLNGSGNFFTENFTTSGSTVTDNGSSNYKVYIEE